MSKIKGSMTLAAVAIAAVLGMTLAQSSSAQPGAASHDRDSYAVSQMDVGDVFCVQATSCSPPGFNFNSAFDTHVYTVFMGANATRLTVKTRDCCIAGDNWGVVMNRFGASGKPVTAAVSNGSTTKWTGPATLTGPVLSGRVVQVTVFHAAGVSNFPAGLDILFRSDTPIQKVTQRAGQG